MLWNPRGVHYGFSTGARHKLDIASLLTIFASNVRGFVGPAVHGTTVLSFYESHSKLKAFMSFRHVWVRAELSGVEYTASRPQKGGSRIVLPSLPRGVQEAIVCPLLWQGCSANSTDVAKPPRLHRVYLPPSEAHMPRGGLHSLVTSRSAGQI